MKWTEKELNALEEFGSHLFKTEEIAILMGVDGHQFAQEMANPASDTYKAYHKGRLVREMKIRASIFELAEGGSAAAQALAKQFMDEIKLDWRLPV